jgi:gamma-glutamyl:cysteine ligase YbdK (ATP-grasp superfamily)
MPTAMHPLMDPESQTRIWPHEYQEVYESFNRIFDCRGHGWSNLQSMHINLPFGDDDQFGRLHAAIRMVLPILPALAASSPIVGGVPSGFLDTRLEYYRQNCRRVPSVAGRVIPEAVFTRGEYEGSLLEGIYRDIRPYDPDGILQYEWLNARGAIARFDRGAIEIRLLDVQESPLADLAVAQGVVSAVRALVDGRLCSLERQKSWSAERLEPILLESIRSGEGGIVTDADYLADMGLAGERSVPASAIWRGLVELGRRDIGQPQLEALEFILDQGSLATRILRAVDQSPSIESVYASLCECLAGNRLLGPV